MDIQLPERPPELAALEARRAKIGAQRQEVEAELRRIQDDAWQKSQRNSNHRAADPLDAAAEKLAMGEVEPASRDALPEQADILRSRLDLLQRAGFKLAQKIAELNDLHSRQVARALRPAHRACAARIYRALCALVAANTAEEELRARVPGVNLRPATFPNCGHFGPRGEPAEIWKRYAIREGLIDENDDARFPAAAL